MDVILAKSQENGDTAAITPRLMHRDSQLRTSANVVQTCDHDPNKIKKPMTIKEMASLGDKATAKKFSPAERKQAARKAAQARWAKKKKLGGEPQ
jgi:hypothetical protein